MFKWILAFSLLFIFPANASDSNKNNVLTVISSSVTGQPYFNARILCNYIAKYHPETKGCIVKHVPGAGGLTAANFIYNIAPKDGYTIGIINRSIPIRALIGESGVAYDPLKFTWLGSAGDGRKDPTVLISNKPLDQEIIVAEQNSGEIDIIQIINKVTNLKIKKVSGYKDLQHMRLAYMRGEADGLFNNYTGMMANDSSWENKVVLQYGNGNQKHPRLKEVPTLYEISNDKEIIRLIEVSNILNKSFVAPPNLPKDKTELLRNAFEKAVNDPDYIKEAATIQMDPSLITWQEANKILEELYGLKAVLSSFHFNKQ